MSPSAPLLIRHDVGRGPTNVPYVSSESKNCDSSVSDRACGALVDSLSWRNATHAHTIHLDVSKEHKYESSERCCDANKQDSDKPAEIGGERIMKCEWS